MDYRFQIARRYLASRREVSLISIITGISTVGVTLGVASLIVVLSVMNGFYDVVRGVLVSLDPHVRVVSAQGEGVANVDSLLRVARETRHVTAAAPYVEGKALLMSDNTGDANRVVRVRGVEASMMEGAAPTMAMGRFDLSRNADGVPGVVLNQRLGQRAGLAPAGRAQSSTAVGLLSAPAVERTLTNIFGGPPVRRLEVRGLLQSQGTAKGQRVFVSLAEAQQLFRTEGRVTGVELRLDNLERAAGVKAALQRKLGTDRYTVQTWYDLQRSLYDVMQLEKWGASAILGLIVIVAAFNIVGSLTMVVIEKRADVGALQAMGVSRGDVRRIFLLEGALIGALGTGLGLVLGLGLAFLQQHYGLVPMAQAESFLIDAYPVSVQALDVVLIAVVSFGLCVLAALYPAVPAAAIEPALAVHLGG